MRTMRSQEELDLKPDRMFGAEQLAVIVIVLEPNLGEFTRIESDHRRNPRPLAAINIAGIVSARVPIRVLATQTCHPPRLETPENLRIKTPIAKSFRRQ